MMAATKTPGKTRKWRTARVRTRSAMATAKAVPQASAGSAARRGSVRHSSDWPVSTLNAPPNRRKPEPARKPPHRVGNQPHEPSPPERAQERHDEAGDHRGQDEHERDAIGDPIGREMQVAEGAREARGHDGEDGAGVGVRTGDGGGEGALERDYEGDERGRHESGVE